MKLASSTFATTVLKAAIAVPFTTFTITYILFYTVADEARHRRDPAHVSFIVYWRSLNFITHARVTA